MSVYASYHHLLNFKVESPDSKTRYVYGFFSQSLALIRSDIVQIAIEIIICKRKNLCLRITDGLFVLLWNSIFTQLVRRNRCLGKRFLLNFLSKAGVDKTRISSKSIKFII